MENKTRFFAGFHRNLFGSRPVTARERLARKAREADRLCLTQLDGLFGGILPDWLRNYKTGGGTNSRHSTYTVLVTFWAFLSQILDPDGCCRRAVTRVQTLCSALRLRVPGSDTAAYCTARARLPIRVLLRVFHSVASRLTCGPRTGRRMLVMDGTSITLADSPRNAAAYRCASGQKPGCGFPLMALLGLFDLATGALLAVAKSKSKAHDARLAWRLLRHLEKGDILIADRAFCSYAFIAACQARGVDVILRLHQRRDPQIGKGRRLGNGDWRVEWTRPAQCPKGQHPGSHAAQPASLPLRLVKVQSQQRGHRTRELSIVTTLLDPRQHSAGHIASSYLRRWQVELFFDDIKTSLGMETLRCKSPHMIARELLMHLIAYNLVRHLIARAEPLRAPDAVHPLSFKGTLDRFEQWQWPIWATPNARQARARTADMLASIAEDEVPRRPGRKEPRVLKRRPKSYTFMTKPRSQYTAADDLAHAA